MPVMDEFKEERAALKNGTLKDKLQYFWDYYKWYVIVGILAILFIVSMVHQAITKKDIAFYACIMNSTPKEYWEDSSVQTNAFAEYAGIDTDTCDVIYDTTIQIGMNTGDDLNSSQKLMVYIASAEIDVMVTDAESIQKYAYLDNYCDLRDFLSPEQYEKYKDSFYYVDRAVIDEMNRDENIHSIDYVPPYKDPFHPEEMTDPVPTGIFLGENSTIRQNFFFQSDQVVVSVLRNTTRPELSSQFIDYLMLP